MASLPNSAADLLQIGRDIRIPRVISKSMIKATACATYFAGYYLEENPPVRLIPSGMAETGHAFHLYRGDYINHLVNNGLLQDGAFVVDWLTEHSDIPEDARLLIERDARTFAITENTYGAEIFLSVDKDFRPIERQIGEGKPGRRSTHPRAFLSGSIDELQLDGGEALVNDSKSGWSTSSVDEAEPEVYAALVFSHFPAVERVEFRWEFIRPNLAKRVEYSRSELPRLIGRIRAAYGVMTGIARQYAAGEQLEANPWSGLCGFCRLSCPLVRDVEDHRVSVAPVRSPEDARKLGRYIYVAEQFLEQARPLLRAFLDQCEGGRLDLGADFVAELRHRVVSGYPLPAVLELLGIAEPGVLPDKSPAFAVPLDRLQLRTSKLKGYAKAKFRAGLAEQLAAIAEQQPQTVMQLRRLNEADYAGLEGAAEAAGFLEGEDAEG